MFNLVKPFEDLVDLPIFYEDSHSYIGTNGDMKGKKYTSATTVIHEFEPKKDWYAIAEGYVNRRTYYEIVTDLATKQNRTIDEVIELISGREITPELVQWFWKLENTKSCTFGTEIHLTREFRWKALEEQGHRVYTNMTNSEGWKQARTLTNLEEGAHPEIILWSEYYGVSGQSDLVKVRGKQISISDLKTNKKLSKQGFRGEMLIGPLSHIPNANFYIYSLQLSLYAYLLERQGYEVGKLHIEYVRENGKMYELEYMRKEVIDMLEYRKNEINKQN